MMGKDTRPTMRAAKRRHYAKYSAKMLAHKKEVRDKKRKRLMEKYGTLDVPGK